MFTFEYFESCCIFVFHQEIMSFKVTKTLGSKTPCQLQNSGMPTESIPDTERLELSLSPCKDILDQGGKRNTLETAANKYKNGKSIKQRICRVLKLPDFSVFVPFESRTLFFVFLILYLPNWLLKTYSLNHDLFSCTRVNKCSFSLQLFVLWVIEPGIITCWQ